MPPSPTPTGNPTAILVRWLAQKRLAHFPLRHVTLLRYTELLWISYLSTGTLSLARTSASACLAPLGSLL